MTTRPNTEAVVFSAPGEIARRSLRLRELAPDEVRVQTVYSGISTGTERLLFRGEMPAFPGMGYPLVPGYESVGRITEVGAGAEAQLDQWVFVPGANCYQDARGLFGGASQEMLTSVQRVIALPSDPGPQMVLLALAATALHAIHLAGSRLPDLVVGHGVMGRLAARITVALGGQPMVWETHADRRFDGQGYITRDPSYCKGQQFDCILDASGAGDQLDHWVSSLAPGGQIILAGFYSQPLRFQFVPAFLRETQLKVAAQWQPADLQLVSEMVHDGRLSLDGLVTDVMPATDPQQAYEKAFDDFAALKVVMDWRCLS
jgi:3-hydroxyethyl bacteriochlorophyllide a dehydrogenase